MITDLPSRTATPEELEPFELPPMESLVLEGLQQYVRSEVLAAWLSSHEASHPRTRCGTPAAQEAIKSWAEKYAANGRAEKPKDDNR